MDKTHIYHVDVTGIGDDSASLSSTDGLTPLPVGPPPQFGGVEGIWSPEHLFVASVASCLMTTFRAIAKTSGVEILDYTDSASGTLIRDENRLYRMSEVTLRPRVVIADPGKIDRAARLLEKAETVCLISRSIDAEVHIEPEVSAAAA